MVLNNEKALVVFSGGQDSTTCLFWAKKRFKEVWTLSFRYGQKHQNETEIAQKIAEKANVHFHVMDVPFIGNLSSHCALINKEIPMDEVQPAQSVPNTFVPGRNLFSSVSLQYMPENVGYDTSLLASRKRTSADTPTARDSFIKSLNVTLNLAMEEQFVIHTPLMWIDKAKTWKLADKLGVFDLVRNETLTCYNGIPGDGCGHCPSCHLRQQGLMKYLKEKEEECSNS